MIGKNYADRGGCYAEADSLDRTKATLTSLTV